LRDILPENRRHNPGIKFALIPLIALRLPFIPMTCRQTVIIIESCMPAAVYSSSPRSGLTRFKARIRHLCAEHRHLYSLYPAGDPDCGFLALIQRRAAVSRGRKASRRNFSIDFIISSCYCTTL
jgi:hypothetical protein